MERSTVLLLALGGALVLLIRYRKDGKTQTLAVDALEEVVASVDRLSSWSVPAAGQRFMEVFRAATLRYGLPPLLLPAVAWRESRFRDDIIDGRTRSSAGAVGIMQVIPRWHPELGEDGALDPARAIPYAAWYLSDLFRQFGSWSLALAAYNWGPGNLAAALQNGTPWPAETRAYVEEITRNAGLA